MQGAGRVQGEQDIQFRRAIGFSNQQSGHGGVLYPVTDVADGLRAGFGDSEHIRLGVLDVAQLQQPKDYVELVGKLMGVGSQCLDDVLYPGQVLGELGYLCAVAENRHSPLNFSVVPKGNPIGKDGDMGDGFQTDIVFRQAGPHYPGNTGAGINRLQWLPQRGGLINLQNF